MHHVSSIMHHTSHITNATLIVFMEITVATTTTTTTTTNAITTCSAAVLQAPCIREFERRMCQTAKGCCWVMIKCCVMRVACHRSYVTRQTSYVTRHTSRITALPESTLQRTRTAPKTYSFNTHIRLIC